MKKLALFSLVALLSVASFGQKKYKSGDFFFDVATKAHTGISSVFKFGRSVAIGSTESVCWDGGGAYTFITGAYHINVFSASATDSLGGTGAWTLIMSGLDSLHNEISEVITLAGTDTVVSVNKYHRLYRAFVLQSGTNSTISDANAGVISFKTAVGDTLQAQIKARNGQTLMSVYTVPSGKTAYITGVGASVGEGKQCLIKYKIRNGDEPTGAFSVKYTLELYESTVTQNLAVPLQIPEKTDIVVTGTTSTGTINMSSSFGLILIDNE